LVTGDVLLVDEDLVRLELGDEHSDPSHLGGDLCHRVLAQDRAVEHRWVERSAVLSRDHPGEPNDVTYHVGYSGLSDMTTQSLCTVWIGSHGISATSCTSFSR